ncbi:hypothetical protein AWJ20_4254 [Sugiyamaella lignohabitans]|uniref:Uncharacterized protein n=1 Tax=Sugiyamaella lignohabitans TaxID=796027 RepID=A0A167CAV8_9ASCO|nr:uncharacterized protein AWJ20_4254 [Sugiyamaella lignohabitans]ANB11444.1 hypothetical protein AWJ20_4254 [Sugiyamaella lignohabitans]
MAEPDDPFYQLGPVRDYLMFVAEPLRIMTLGQRRRRLKKLVDELSKFGYLNVSNRAYNSLPLSLSVKELEHDHGRSALDTLKRDFYINLEDLCYQAELYPCILEFLTAQFPERQQNQVENLTAVIVDIFQIRNVEINPDWQAYGPCNNFKDIVALFVDAHSPRRMHRELEQLFRRPYNDPSSTQHLFNHIKDTVQGISYGSPRIYSPCIPIIQSSMYGKSRLIKDLASHHVYLSYMCLRENSSLGYPRARFSRSIGRGNTSGYLASKNDSTFARDVLLFLICTLEAIVEGLQHTTDKYAPVEEFWTFQEKSSFFEKTVEKSFEDKKDSENDIWKALSSPGAVSSKDDRLVLSEEVKKKLQSEWIKYCLALWMEDKDKEVYFVLAIDEASPLGIQNKPQGMSKPYYQILRSVARCLVFEKLWGGFAIVIADTSGRISDFSPPHENDRFLKKFRAIAAEPWYRIPYDVNVRWSDPPLTLDFSQIGTLRFYAKFGRPMWKLYFDTGNEDELLTDATAKLRGRDYDRLSKYHVLFVIYAPSMDSDYRTAESFLQSRMATLLWMSDQHDVLKVGYPSEPILVMAAHKILEGENDLDLISHLLREKSLSPGTTGEFVARWMLLDVLKTVGLRDGIQSNYCRVRDLFDGLRSKYELTCRSGNTNEHQLLNERIHLNHWVSDRRICTVPMLAYGFLRGYGFCFSFNQEGFDLVIPIYLESKQVDLTNIRFFDGYENMSWEREDVYLADEAFSVILIQVRNNQNSRDNHYVGIHEKMGSQIKHMLARAKPYITLYMQLGEGRPIGFGERPRSINRANVAANQEHGGNIRLQEGGEVVDQGAPLAYDLRVTYNENNNNQFIDQLRRVIHLPNVNGLGDNFEKTHLDSISSNAYDSFRSAVREGPPQQIQREAGEEDHVEPESSGLENENTIRSRLRPRPASRAKYTK